jgi:predicted AlkP superfamily pyrophosphatase or phosphodiesterase
MDFAALPMTVERLLAGGEGGLDAAALPAGPAPERVAVVLLDAFGARSLERHAEHPLLRRIAAEGVITPLATQFPSTTAAHVTTMHTGRPVGEHGLYEWRVYEPALGRVILPLPFALPDGKRDSLRATGLDPEALVPPGTLYERLAAAGVDSVAIEPSSFCPSTFDRVAAKGARLRPFGELAEGAAVLREELTRPGRRYAYLYWDRIDLVGHHEGPGSDAFLRESLAALDVLEGALRDLPGTLVLLTADHGQVAVSPDRVDYLDELWPGLARHLTLPPAGSARDCFLHTRAPELVAGELAARLGERAEVRLVADMVADGWFGVAGPRLRAHLADVCVLPAPGRQAWVRSAASVEQTFRGAHGGRHPDECETWVGAFYS